MQSTLRRRNVNDQQLTAAAASVVHDEPLWKRRDRAWRTKSRTYVMMVASAIVICLCFMFKWKPSSNNVFSNIEHQMSDSIGDYVDNFDTTQLIEQIPSFQRFCNESVLPFVDISTPYHVHKHAEESADALISDEEFLECLVARNATSLIIMGDSQSRFIMDAIGRSMDRKGLIEGLETNSYRNYLSFNTLSGVHFERIPFTKYVCIFDLCFHVCF